MNEHTEPAGIGVAGEAASASVRSMVPLVVGPFVSVHEYWTGKTRVVPPV